MVADTLSAMGMRIGRCWFERCHAVGAIADFDGQPSRSLCPKHASGVRLALEQPSTFEVSWGRSKAEQIAKRQAALPAAIAWAREARAAFVAYGPPRHPETGLPMGPQDAWLGEEDPEHVRLELEAADAETALSGIHDQIGEIEGQPWDHPIVRVNVRTA